MSINLVLEPYDEVNYRSIEEAETYAKRKPNSWDIEAYINGTLYFKGFMGEWAIHPFQHYHIFMRLVRRAERQDDGVILP